jgi:hypothetical protein
MKFSQITTNNTPSASDYAVGVSAGAVDQKSTWASILGSLAWMPDYANKSATNLWASGYTTTIATKGFVAIYVNAYAALSYGNAVTVNGVEILKTYNEVPSGSATAVISNIIPVNAGDVVAVTNAGSFNAKICNFVPGRLV